MRDPIGDFLALHPMLVLDGALATELESRGADLGHPLWSAKCLLDCPQLIKEVHLDYFRAGADVATTATYQASFEGFERLGIGRDGARRLMLEAIALAIAARDEFWADASHHSDRSRPLIAASVGPYGAMLADGSEYRGHYGLDQRALADFHRPRLQALAAAGADFLAFETIPCLREAQALASLLREFSGVCATLSFSCQDGLRNCQGENIGECVAALEDCEQIIAVGVNCTPPQYVASLLRRMRAATIKPLMAYPNSGEQYLPGAKQWGGGRAAAPFGEQARIWWGEGARLIGGCCRTSPSDIRSVKQCMPFEPPP
jgi:homocysteine S-methyltransferase